MRAARIPVSSATSRSAGKMAAKRPEISSTRARGPDDVGKGGTDLMPGHGPLALDVHPARARLPVRRVADDQIDGAGEIAGLQGFQVLMEDGDPVRHPIVGNVGPGQLGPGLPGPRRR